MSFTNSLAISTVESSKEPDDTAPNVPVFGLPTSGSPDVGDCWSKLFPILVRPSGFEKFTKPSVPMFEL